VTIATFRSKRRALIGPRPAGQRRGFESHCIARPGRALPSSAEASDPHD
jgi:hypothetical protein